MHHDKINTVTQQQLNEALALFQAGNLPTSKSLLQKIITKHADHAEANYYLGAVLVAEQNPQASLTHFQVALEADSAVEHYWVGYINALILTEQIEHAQLVLNYAGDAGLSEAWVIKLTDAIQSNQIQNESQCEDQPLAAIELELLNLFSEKDYALLEVKTLDYLAQHPNWLNGWKILSDTYLIQGKDAKFAAQKALALNPEDAKEHCYYGLMLKNEGDLLGASSAFAQAIALAPNYAAAYNNLGIVKKDLGDVEAGIQYYRAALKLNPNYASCFSNLLFCLSHYEKISARALFNEHLTFGQQFESKQKQRGHHQHVANPNKVLNVGFVSADFRDHSVAYCFAPVIAHLARSSQFNCFAYYNHTIVDDITLDLKSHFNHWRDVHDWSDEQLADHIQHDAIDILVDLSGHTAGNRLTLFAMKPAPIQATWFGYMATTGLKTTDYYLADQYLLPPKQFDHLFTEKIVQLSVNATFSPPKITPDVSALPALKNGYITFGCFNRPSKISRAAIALWSKLLIALPNAKLLLGAMPQAGSDDGILQNFLGYGITQDRLILRTRSDLHNYQCLHHAVDICLDTMPSSGVTTTLYAAWMGVPTLCIAGNNITSRGAMAIMSHLKCAQFVGMDAEDFIKKGLLIAQDLHQLAEVRNSLRQEFLNSPISQPKKHADNLQNAFLQMWQTWCARKPARTFSI
jgi:predicted O-linked N-acetylglucosamine transferase (SPINDLY family)